MPRRVVVPGPDQWCRGAACGPSVGLVVVVAVGLAGCAGGAAAIPVSTAPPTVTLPATLPVTLAPTSIAPPPATTPVTTRPAAPTSSVQAADVTTTTTSTPADPGSPSRVTFPDDPTRQAVVDAAYAFFDAARAAQASPTDPGLRQTLARTVAEPLAGRMTAFLDGLVADGVRIVGSDVSPTRLEIIGPTVMVADESAIFDACAIDSDIRLDATTAEVLDDDVVSGIQTFHLRKEGGSWIVFDLSLLDRYDNRVGCS